MYGPYELYERVKRFKIWRKSVVIGGSEWPLTAVCVKVKFQIDQRVRNNRRISAEEIIPI
jgi:hypothetical protein